MREASPNLVAGIARYRLLVKPLWKGEEELKTLLDIWFYDREQWGGTKEGSFFHARYGAALLDSRNGPKFSLSCRVFEFGLTIISFSRSWFQRTCQRHQSHFGIVFSHCNFSLIVFMIRKEKENGKKCEIRQITW